MKAPIAIADLLREADTLLQGMFSNALIGIYVIQDNRFIYVNQRLADLFGYTQDELCAGLGPMDLTAPEHRALARQEIESRVTGKTQESFYHFHGITKDGRQLDAEVFGVSTSFSGRPAIIGILLDVSDRYRAERAAADQLRFIERLIDTIPSPIYYKDERGLYLGCNTAFERYTGVPRDELIGRSVYDIVPQELATQYTEDDEDLFNKPGTQTYETVAQYADGTRHEVIIHKATFNKADGGLGGLVGVMHDISDRKRMEEAIWREANYDALTSLPNRRLLRERLTDEIARAHRNGSTLALLYVDLDGFKEVNDILGHHLGDHLLCEVAQRIRKVLRASDMLGRQSGDEFIIALPDLSDELQSGRVAQAILDTVSQPFVLEGQLAYVSASIGIASYPQDSENIDFLVSHADQAMYAAKTQGRNCYCHFTRAMQERAQQRLSIAHELRRAQIDTHFEVHYQPIVDLRNGRVTKAEALVRWRHPQRGLIAPAEFIPVAEEIGMIGDIGNWVFMSAVRAVQEWRALAGEDVQVSVNKSPRQFLSASKGFSWIDYLREQQLPPQALVVEITEGLLLDDRPAVADALLAFRDAGVQVGIDDFGTGYSAMSYLKKFDVDYLKIDRSFIRDITTDPSDLAIAEAVIVMAHKLGMRVVAEGVETAEQRALLQAAGCDFAQGYFYARPMPWPDFLAYVQGTAAGA